MRGYMAESNNLSLEQQFKIVIFRKKIVELNINESRQYLYLIIKYMLIKDNIIKYIMRNNTL